MNSRDGRTKPRRGRVLRDPNMEMSEIGRVNPRAYAPAEPLGGVDPSNPLRFTLST
jgi:hypothetical protein